MNAHPIQKFAFTSLSQITSEDIEKLFVADPTQSDRPLVYQTSLPDTGLITLISEEEEDRKKDFAAYSTETKQIIEWAAREGALYIMFSYHCEEALIHS